MACGAVDGAGHGERGRAARAGAGWEPRGVIGRSLVGVTVGYVLRGKREGRRSVSLTDQELSVLGK